MSVEVGRLRLDFGDWGAGVGRIAILLDPVSWRGIVLPAGFMSDGAGVRAYSVMVEGAVS